MVYCFPLCCRCCALSECCRWCCRFAPHTFGNIVEYAHQLYISGGVFIHSFWPNAKFMASIGNLFPRKRIVFTAIRTCTTTSAYQTEKKTRIFKGVSMDRMLTEKLAQSFSSAEVEQLFDSTLTLIQYGIGMYLFRLDGIVHNLHKRY